MNIEQILGVSDVAAYAFVIGYVCGCSGRGSLVDGLVRRRPGGSRADHQGLSDGSTPDVDPK